MTSRSPWGAPCLASDSLIGRRRSRGPSSDFKFLDFMLQTLLYDASSRAILSHILRILLDHSGLLYSTVVLSCFSGSRNVVDRFAGFSVGLGCALGSRIVVDCLGFWFMGLQVEPVHFSSFTLKDSVKIHFLGD